MKSILHQAITIKFKPSHLLLGLLCVIAMLCCWIALVLPIATTIKIVMIILVLVSSIYFILRDALLALPWSWQALSVDIKGELTLINQRGQQFKPALADSTFIHNQLTLLNFKRVGFSLALPPVILLGINTDETRRLRVWLRWFKYPQPNQDLAAASD